MPFFRSPATCRRFISALIPSFLLACGGEESPGSAAGGGGAAAGGGGPNGGASGATSGGSAGNGGTAGSGAGAGSGSGGTSTGTGTFTINVSLSPAIATVGIVEWSIDTAIMSARIDFGRDPNALEYQAPVDLAEPGYRTLLLGMKPSTTYSFRIVAEGGGQTHTSPVQTIETGFLPNGLPVIDVTDMNAGALWAGGGFTIACTGYETVGDVGANPSWAFIFDKDGDQVWALDMSDTGALACTRARLSLDGKYLWAGNFANTTATGAISRVTMDGLSTPEDFPLPGRSHDFAILPNGNIVYFARNSGGGGQSPESIRELDPATGQTSLIYDQTSDFGQAIGTQGGHTNQVNYVPELGAISFSMLFIDTIAYVSYPGGELLGVFGGSQSSFPGMSWNDQHGHDLREDRLTIFNNSGSNGGASILRYQLDLQASTAMELSDYSSGEDSIAFGDVKELPNGNYYVTYSSTSVIHEIASSLELLREIEINALIGYTEHRATLYGPPPPYDR